MQYDYSKWPLTSKARPRLNRVLTVIAVFSVMISGLIGPIAAAQEAPGEYLAETSVVEVLAEVPSARTAPAITVDVQAEWHSNAPEESPAGHQMLAYFVINANDIDYGSAGYANFKAVIEGVNAGFATYARGTISNGGRTLTIPFNNFPLATSERFGFSLIGDQAGPMSANIRVYNLSGVHLNNASLTPRPVAKGTVAWDLVLSQTAWWSGGIQEQYVVPLLNLTIDQGSPIPTGDIIFYFGFADINPESTRVPAVSRFRYRQMAPGRITLNVHNGDDFTVAYGTAVSAYVTEIPGTGWRFQLPVDGFNPFQYLPRNGQGGALHPNVRAFASIGLEFYSGIIPTQFQDTVFFAGNIWGATWGGIAETDRNVTGITTEVGGVQTVNNRVAYTFTPAGQFSAVWVPHTGGGSHESVLWGEIGQWPPTPSLQNGSAVYSALWSASDYLPYGSEVMARSHVIGTGYTAACHTINKAQTPFQGRVIVSENLLEPNPDRTRLWATTAPVGNLVGVDCHKLGGWFEVPRSFVFGSNVAAFDLPNPADITAVKGIGRVNVTIDSMHYTWMAAPAEAGWVTARGWWPRSADVNDFYQVTSNSESEHARPQGQLFATTNGSRDVLFGNYGFPRIVKSASNTNPALGEVVTFTIQAANVSNLGSMEMLVRDQMDTRLQFVPGSVKVNGATAADPIISAAQYGKFDTANKVHELLFNLGSKPVNQIVTITYQAIAHWDVGTVLNTAWMEPTAQARANGFAGIGTANGTLSQVALHRQLTGNVELTKSVARSYMGPDIGDPALFAAAQNTWQLSVHNGTSGGAHSVIVDIFPFYGDGRGTTANVSHALAGFATDHPVTVYYTTADPQLISPDPWAPENANRSDGSSIWQRWDEFGSGQFRSWLSSARPTAMLIATTSPIASGSRVQFEIPFTAITTGTDQGVFVNYAWQRDDTNQLRLVRAAVTIAEFPEIKVTKTIDRQSQIGVPSNTPQQVVFELTNSGTEPLTSITFADITWAGPAVDDFDFGSWRLDASGYLVDDANGGLLVLAPGEMVTILGTLPGLAPGEQHQNIVTVTGVGVNSGNPTEDSDELIVDAVVPGIQIEKFLATGLAAVDLLNSSRLDEVLTTDVGPTDNGNLVLLADPESREFPELEVTFRITNTGTEPLTNLFFTDTTLEFPALTSISFTDVPSLAVNDGPNTDVAATGIWQMLFPGFVLLPGEVLYGTGTLPQPNDDELRHHNVALIIGEGVITGDTVADDDEFIVEFIRPLLTALPVSAPELTQTGVAAIGLWIATGSGLGGAALLTGQRNRKSRQLNRSK